MFFSSPKIALPPCAVTIALGVGPYASNGQSA
jgi:hypothetical protein